VKIYASDDGASGCAWYRLIMPLNELGKHDGHDVEFAAQPLMRKGDRAGIDILKARQADITVAQRLYDFESLKGWRRLAPFTKLVYELDDDVFSIEPVNWGPYQTFGRAEIRNAVAHYIETSDMVTVTCESLAQVMRQHNDNVHILPNHIPGWVLDLPAPQGDRPAVGWMGGASHGLDLGLVARPLRQFLSRNPGWDAVVVGVDYRPTIKHNRCGFIPWTHVTDEPEAYYQSIDFDIGVAPVLEGTFAKSKSYIKALEYGARGIPIIASDVTCYRDYVIDGVTGFLVRYEHEWLDRLQLLASDEGLRLSMGAKAKELARQHTIDDGWRKWEAAYKGLLG